MTYIMDELNEQETMLIHAFANSQFPSLIYTMPDITLDSPDEYATFFNTQKNLDHLTRLGLITNDTENAKDLLDSIRASQPDSPRSYRVFSVTKEGRMMFNLAVSDNRPN